MILNLVCSSCYFLRTVFKYNHCTFNQPVQSLHNLLVPTYLNKVMLTEMVCHHKTNFKRQRKTAVPLLQRNCGCVRRAAWQLLILVPIYQAFSWVGWCCLSSQPKRSTQTICRTCWVGAHTPQICLSSRCIPTYSTNKFEGVWGLNS